MVTLNCTKKFTKWLPFDFDEGTNPSTNKLGSWCANSFSSDRLPLILLTNEKSLLTVVIPVDDIHTFHDRFLVSLEILFHQIGVPSHQARAEIEDMMAMQFTGRTNRSVLGSMNDFVFQAKSALQREPDLSLQQLSFDLSEIPCAPLRYDFPREVALTFFAPPPPFGLKLHYN